MSDLEAMKKQLHSELKLNGITIRREFCSLIIDSLQTVALYKPEVYDNVVKTLCESFEKDHEAGKGIERPNILRAIEACLRSGNEDTGTVFNVINVFDVRKLQYNLERKLYNFSKDKPRLLSTADDKAQLFINRYNAVLQRTQRHFINIQSTMNVKEIVTLHTVDFLLTVSKKPLENRLILGSLLQGPNAQFYLEDPTGMVEINLRKTKYHDGFFNENCFVLVNGFYEDKILYISTMLLPPGEEYKDSKITFNNLNYFGGPSELPLRESEKLLVTLRQHAGAMMLFFSDVFLDQPVVFEKLEVLFEGFSESPPIAIIMMGNFLSKSYGSESVDLLQKQFKQLAELITKYELIAKHSRFVFVPGMNDPCLTYMAPRAPLPKVISEGFTRMLPNSTFTSNPCRIQYCNKEVVVYRANVLSKFMQEALNSPGQNELDDYIAKTIVTQGHLSPFSLNIQPVHWSFDHTLFLYPLPNLVVIGDKSSPYLATHKECCVTNPGSFIDSGFSFKSYTPSSDSIDDCAL